MRNQITRVLSALAIAVLLAGFSDARLAAQTASTRRLTVDDAVRLALEQNLGIKIERLSPQMQDFVVTDARSAWVPTVSSTLANNRANTPSTNAFSGVKLQSSQTDLQLKNLELQVVAQVRDTARRVETNQKRIDSVRAARVLAEQRVEAEQKKYAAGVETSFFVFQAQRDLRPGPTKNAPPRTTTDRSRTSRPSSWRRSDGRH
jgi:outer membrane protein TolC